MSSRTPVAPIVCKLGGRAFDDPLALPRFAAEMAARRDAFVLVHGGGPEVSAWSERLGLTPRFFDGLRVTDPATLEVAVAVLAGLANKRLVAALRAAGIDAVGIAALDGGVVEVDRHARAEALGEVGEIRSIDPSLLTQLIASGRTPVIASIGAAGGRLLNVNADDVAAAIAGALRASALLLLGDAESVMLDGTPRARLLAAELDAALDHPDVKDGMRPKLRAARTSLRAGVGQVRIARYGGTNTLASLLGGEGTGTLCIQEKTAHV